MSTSILRTVDAWWVSSPDGATRIDTAARTTGELLTGSLTTTGAPVPVDSLKLLSPITAPCRVVAQMTNYVSHVLDTGLDPRATPLTFFRKSSGSISGPHDDIVKPAHVRLLDYEAEIGLVMGVDNQIAGLVITNDVSARDLQLPKTQFYESKSYPTFTPAGPALVLLDPGEIDRFADLRLRLWVNGELRQDMTAHDMIYPPAQALRALTRFQRLDPGDLVLTGTPVGTALSAPPKPVQLIASLLPAATKWRMFF
ncbi:MAG TPA: fumarylacetoacetate hydrolase family protein, partial [Lentzea sp.]